MRISHEAIYQSLYIQVCSIAPGTDGLLAVRPATCAVA